MKEHVYTTSDNREIRIRYYSDRLELVIDGFTHSFPNGPLIKYIRNACNVYLKEFPLDGETIFTQEETLLTQENTKVDEVSNPISTLPVI